MEDERIKEAVLDAVIVSLDAQLRAVRGLRGKTEAGKPRKKSMSQVDMVYDVLKKAKAELHVSEIIKRVEQVHGARLERESIVSALSKKIKKGDRFQRVGRNTYALVKE